MSKITFSDIQSTEDLTELNQNFTDIEQEFQNNVLYRDNPEGEPNHMEQDLDMNSNRILNLPTPTNNSEAARLVDIQNSVAGGSANLITYGDTNVKVALDNRVIRVSSRTEMKTYDVTAGYQFSLEEGGRSGTFVVKSGTPPTDTLEGVYVVLDNGNYAERTDWDKGPLNIMWWGAEEGSASAAAVQAAIDLSPDRVKNIAGGNAWQVSNATEIFIPKTKATGYYEIEDKLKIPPQKNVRFRCESPSAAAFKYTGPGYVMFEFQPGGICRSIGIDNLACVEGDVAVIGGNNGMIWFDQPQFYSAPNRALWFVDAVDYTDGPGGEYPSGYTGPNESAGVNTVFVGLNRPAFHYCENGLYVESTTILLFKADRPRFNATKKAPLTLDCIDARIIEPEIQSINEWQNYGLINIPSIKNTAAYIYIEHPRFGAEEFTGDTDGLLYKPPENSIVVGELGAYVGGNAVTQLIVKDALAFGNNTTADTQHFIYANRRMIDARIEGGIFRNYQGDLIVESAYDNTGTSDVRCVWRDNVIEASVSGNTFSSGGNGWNNEDQRLQLSGDNPTIAAGAAGGAGATASVSGNDSAGTITVTTGTGATNGDIGTITFSGTFNEIPRILLTPTTSTAAGLAVHTRVKTQTSFILRTGTALSDSTTYAFDYIAIGTLN